jgi:hypothetical protein
MKKVQQFRANTGQLALDSNGDPGVFYARVFRSTLKGGFGAL